jgi:anionic cell wall polymer biosynthesis LytR-Cps2A-Psr (LCP) family protein
VEWGERATARPSFSEAGVFFGMAALTDEIGFLLGSKIDYYASVDLDGFSRLIDRGR